MKDDVLRINRELEAQLRELVRGQQELFLAERESARQLACLETLTRFAASAAEVAEPRAVLDRAARLVFELFPFEQCLAFLENDGALVAVVARVIEGLRPTVSVPELGADAPTIAWPNLDAPVFDSASALTRAHGLEAAMACVDALFGGAADDAPVLALPLARSDGSAAAPVGLMIFRRVSGRISFHDEFPSPNRAAFLALTARHVAAALANARRVRDLTASYAELERAQTVLVDRERLAALGELAAQVAHEVRNPLGAIFNAVSLLKPLLPTPDEALHPILTILVEESTRINAIVSDLLEFARPTSLSFQSEAIVPLVRAAMQALRTTMPSAVVHLDAGPDLPPVHIDARVMRQALVNLLANAAQASEGGAPVHVVVRRDAERLAIDVVNVGPEIPPATLARVFEPFFTTKASGTGLGLSVVKRAIDAHGGQVTATSTSDATVFRVTLPVGESGAQEPTTALAGGGFAPGSARPAGTERPAGALSVDGVAPGASAQQRKPIW